MAPSVHVAGAAPIYVDYGIGLRLFGYTANGAEASFNGFWANVPGDQNGGDQGPPIDIQYFGETADIRLLMTKWDADIADMIAARVAGGTAGTPATAGSLVFGSGGSFRVVIASPNDPLNFPRCIPRGAITINKGSQHSRLALEFEAHKNDSGVLYNSTTG